MTLLDHPIFAYVLPYASLDEERSNVDFLQLPDDLRALALDVTANCVACGRPIHPLRARQQSQRSRVAGLPVERRLFYAPTCPTEVNAGCSRTRSAHQHKAQVCALLCTAAAPVSPDTYDALCLKEPWLELILLGIKTLETRTKLMRKRAGDVVLTSSTVDEDAWSDPRVGGRLSPEAASRCLASLGKMRGLVHMGGFRPGVPGVEDAAACISILLPSGEPRYVSACSNVRRLVEVPTVRVSPDGSLTPGSGQGFFRVPRARVEVLT